MLGATEPACAASEIRFWKSLADCPHEARINEIASVIATPAPTCAGLRATGGAGGAGADAGASSACSLVPPNTPVMKRTTRERSSRPMATPPYPMSIEYGSGATATSGKADGTPNHSSVTATAVTASIAMPTPAIHVATRDGGNVAVAGRYHRCSRRESKPAWHSNREPDGGHEHDERDPLTDALVRKGRVREGERRCGALGGIEVVEVEESIAEAHRLVGVEPPSRVVVATQLNPRAVDRVGRGRDLLVGGGEGDHADGVWMGAESRGGQR